MSSQATSTSAALFSPSLDRLQFRLVRDAGDDCPSARRESRSSSGREGLVECCAWNGLRNGNAIRGDELRQIAKGGNVAGKPAGRCGASEIAAMR